MAKTKTAANAISHHHERLWRFVVESSDQVSAWPSWKKSGTTTPTDGPARAEPKRDSIATKSSNR